MAQTKIPLKEFFDSFKNSLGIEGAERLIRQSIQHAGLSYQIEYSKEDALKICRELKKHPGFVGIVGGILLSRFMIR